MRDVTFSWVINLFNTFHKTYPFYENNCDRYPIRSVAVSGEDMLNSIQGVYISVIYTTLER